MFGVKIFFSVLLKTSMSKDRALMRDFPAQTGVKYISQDSRQHRLVSEKISSESKMAARQCLCTIYFRYPLLIAVCSVAYSLHFCIFIKS